MRKNKKNATSNVAELPAEAAESNVAVLPVSTTVRKAKKTIAEICDETEAELIRKWGSEVTIVPDSCMPAEEGGEFAGKMTVEIVCVDCGVHRRIATQDVFQVRRCKACTKIFQKANKRAKRANSPEGRAAAERVAAMKAAKAKKDEAKRAKQLAKLDEQRAKLVS